MSMFASGLIVFRETLEAALFTGILAAASKGLPRRGLWLAAGVLAGLLGAVFMALGMEQINTWADGLGGDWLNIGILGVALAMLIWHCVWMSVHGKEMVQQARHLGGAALKGETDLWALALVVAMAVLREGAETVLFVAGFLSGNSVDMSALVLATLGGLGAGALVGVLIYAGLARIRPHHLFSVTNVLIALLAGSLASQLAKALLQAGVVEWGADMVWDTSAWLSNDSAVGVLLHALVGYDASPAGLQVLLYIVVLGGIVLASRWVQRTHQTAMSPR